MVVEFRVQLLSCEETNQQDEEGYRQKNHFLHVCDGKGLLEKTEMAELTKCIDYTHDLLGLLHRHHGTDRQAEFLLVDLLGDGEREAVPRLVTLLLMGRNGIMDEGLDAIFRQMGLQRVALLAQNWEEVIDVVGIGQARGQRYQRIGDVVVIVVGDGLPMCVVFV